MEVELTLKNIQKKKEVGIFFLMFSLIYHWDKPDCNWMQNRKFGVFEFSSNGNLETETNGFLQFYCLCCFKIISISLCFCNNVQKELVQER